MFLYVEQDVNLAKQLCSGLENLKIAWKKVKNLGKRCLAVRKEWVNCRAGHFRYFLIFSIIKNYFKKFFINIGTYFCTIPI